MEITKERRNEILAGLMKDFFPPDGAFTIKTMRGDFPGRFGSTDAARKFLEGEVENGNIDYCGKFATPSGGAQASYWRIK